MVESPPGRFRFELLFEDGVRRELRRELLLEPRDTLSAFELFS